MTISLQRLLDALPGEKDKMAEARKKIGAIPSAASTPSSMLYNALHETWNERLGNIWQEMTSEEMNKVLSSGFIESLRNYPAPKKAKKAKK